MPVILAVLQDPTDLVLQGKQVRAPVAAFPWEANWTPLINALPDRLPLHPQPMLPGMQTSTMLDLSSMPSNTRTPDQAVDNGVRVHACVCTPCGATILVPLGHQWLWNDMGKTTTQFAITGVTRDSAGAALGNCRVIGLETGQLRGTAAPVVGETISDGSGNYTLPVPMNTAYQCIAYKPGSPDVAGITRADVTPVST